MTRDEYRRQWLKWRDAYDIIAFRAFRKALKAAIEGMPFDNITYDNYRFVVPLNVQSQPIFEAYSFVYTTIGLTHGRRVGLGINREIKRFDNDLFSRFFQNSIIEWIRENVGYRIVSVSETIAKRIGRLIEVAADEGMSVYEMQKYLRKRVGDPSFTKYQALRIARTEVTGASNHAAAVAAENSGIVLEKVWIATKDGRTRRKPRDQFDHMHMDGVAVGQYDKFTLRSRGGIVDELEYPGAPNGSAGDVVNCRCTHAYKPMRDADGFVITR